MGDRSPKDKQKNKKQHDNHKKPHNTQANKGNETKSEVSTPAPVKKAG